MYQLLKLAEKAVIILTVRLQGFRRIGKDRPDPAPVFVKDRDPVSHAQCFFNTMGDENARHMHVTEKAEHEPAEFLPVANVQCGKRLIHQDKAGLCHDSPAEGSPLTLAAGEFPGVFLRMRKDPQIF